ncbi:MAG: FHA domain-containing protein [Planctomycetes bacterium]|nr:FHA domain-containing protein [Planctomycetota bacterium]MCH9724749.1 FHA domain-containing protein [Planctomycetota bacterium]MCH9778805.1 FHA domain-containing protein [Planctomycetota bacterium]MCH9790723.1 FHA domain-containing protein [Planctomycetota bacterium]MDF1746063.1 ATP-binding protein [Gimesia sp.]
MNSLRGKDVTQTTLLVIQGVDLGTRFKLGTDPAGVGRGVRNEVRILDTEASRQHALISFKNGSYIITDLNSSNGTLLNGKQIESTKLNNGDHIQIGRSLLLFSSQSIDDDSRYMAEKIDLISNEDSHHSSITHEVNHDFDSVVMDTADVTGTIPKHEIQNDLQALYRVAEASVSPTISQEELLKRILDLTINTVGADRGCMLITDPQSGEILPQIYSSLNEKKTGSRMPVSHSIVDYVLNKKQGVRTSDAQHDQRFEGGRSILQAGIREAMCVPMQGRHELMGVIYVDTTTSHPDILLKNGSSEKFSEEHLRLLVAIGRQSALAIENYRFQNAMLKAERFAAMGQTIATLSHHIKNILQGVRGGSYLIDMGLNKSEEDLVRKGWNIVEKNQNKIYHLVMDMLTFSTERKPALEPGSINTPVKDIFELMQARAEEFGVQLKCELSKDLPESVFDHEGIHRAVLNIVINAIDAVEGAEKGMVLLETTYLEKPDQILIMISDNGPGIPEDQINKIFNLFESTKGSRGTGIGLAVSQKIIREHGGEISIESEAGKGSRFTLSVPRLDEDHPPEASS